ncbi:MAG: hypothetical protein Q4B15_03940 [Lachnospiraceae bacterium]|nr:hypothetical protein [Lachnospiraceae bacterium]
MNHTIEVISIVLPVLLTLAAGIVLRKLRILTNEGIRSIKNLLMNFCIPAIMFQTFYAASFTWHVLLLVFIMAVVTAAAFFAGKLLQRAAGVSQPLFPYLITTFEGGMLGYALFILLFGQDNLYHIALLDLGNALILFPFLTTFLKLRNEGTSPAARDVAKGMITPINIVMFSGILVSITGLGALISNSGFGTVLNATLDFAHTPTSTLILLVVGYGINFSGIRWGETLRTILSRVIIIGILGVIVFFLTGTLFPADPFYRYGAFLFFCLPPSFVYSVYAKGESEETYLGSCLTLYTFITIIGFVLLAMFAV